MIKSYNIKFISHHLEWFMFFWAGILNFCTVMIIKYINDFFMYTVLWDRKSDRSKEKDFFRFVTYFSSKGKNFKMHIVFAKQTENARTFTTKTKFIGNVSRA